jgi:hypothetical protein
MKSNNLWLFGVQACPFSAEKYSAGMCPLPAGSCDQLRHQAKDLLHAIRRSDPDAMVDFREHHPKSIDPATVRLADAQFVLARSCGLPNWTRLVTACRMNDAIWRGLE